MNDFVQNFSSKFSFFRFTFARRKNVSAKELIDESFIIKDKKALLYKFILSELQAIYPQFSFNHLIEINHQNNIIRSVDMNMGVSIISQLALNLEGIENTVSVPLQEGPLFREIICLAPKNINTAQNLFVRYVTKLLCH